MIESVRKNLPRFLALLISFLFLCSLLACGNSDEESDSDTDTFRLSSFTSSETSVTAGQSGILKVIVTDSSDNPISGITISFDFAVDQNKSGGTIETLNGGITDDSGQAYAIYTAGSDNPYEEVKDFIQVGFTKGSSTSLEIIEITRVAAEEPEIGSTLTLTPTPASVTPGNTSFLTAKVTNADSTSAQGIEVTFEIANNNSGAFLTAIVGGATGSTVTGTTDADGIARAIYTAGNNSPTESLQDSISASVTDGASNGTTITRLPEPTAGDKILTLEQIPATSATNRIGTANEQTVIVKATVTRDGSGIKDETLTFAIVSGEGTIDSTSETTGDNGEAYIVFTRPATVGVGDTAIKAEVSGGQAVTVIYWVTLPD